MGLIVAGAVLSCGAEFETASVIGDIGTDTQALIASHPAPDQDSLIQVADRNPAPRIFEAKLTIDEQDVLIDGTTVHSIIYKDDNRPEAYAGIPEGLPIPQIVIDVGDQVVIHFTNGLDAQCAALACDSSIHWHGVELDFDSDGTGVSQNRVQPGETYTYRFYAPRPGVYWFHPHMRPGPQVFAGAYGVFIVRDSGESSLQDTGVIPREENTHTLVLSDTEFDEDGDIGYTSAGEAVPWAALRNSCQAGVLPACAAVADAATVLVNGRHPQSSIPVIRASSGSGIRLRLVNASVNRYFRLRVEGNGDDNRLYRIGGEGGFLEQVRIEGGVLGQWDTRFLPGEIVVPTSGRSDVVIVPVGRNGDIVKIVGDVFLKGGGPSNNTAAGQLLHILIDNSVDGSGDNGFAAPPFSIVEGQDVLGIGSLVDLKALSVADAYVDPVPAVPGVGSGLGSSNTTIELTVVGAPNGISIDGVTGRYEDSGDDFTQVAFQQATRYARVGDTLEFTVHNSTRLTHPFHHHGFSFQPVRILGEGGVPLFEFDYTEFVDVIDVAPGQSVVLRMRLDDRPRLTDTRQEENAPEPGQFFLSGGAAGRWVFHCHIFLHASLGMISELVVLDADRDGDGLDTSMDCNDEDPSVPGLEVCGDGIDNDCNGVIDTDCNHPPLSHAGADRTWECSVPGGTLVTLNGTGSMDEDEDPLVYSWSAPGIEFDDPGTATPMALFPLGTTVVTLAVSDGALHSESQVNITVSDTVAPVVEVSLHSGKRHSHGHSGVRSWHKGGKFQSIVAEVLVTDACQSNPSFVLESIERRSARHKKDFEGHSQRDVRNAQYGTPDVLFSLRSGRSAHGKGRSYQVSYSATDDSGNRTSTAADVKVGAAVPMGGAI